MIAEVVLQWVTWVMEQDWASLVYLSLSIPSRCSPALREPSLFPMATDSDDWVVKGAESMDWAERGPLIEWLIQI